MISIIAKYGDNYYQCDLRGRKNYPNIDNLKHIAQDSKLLECNFAVTVGANPANKFHNFTCELDENSCNVAECVYALAMIHKIHIREKYLLKGLNVYQKIMVMVACGLTYKSVTKYVIPDLKKVLVYDDERKTYTVRGLHEYMSSGNTQFKMLVHSNVVQCVTALIIMCGMDLLHLPG